MATYPVSRDQKVDIEAGLYLINKNNEDSKLPRNFIFWGREFVCLHNVFMPEDGGHHCFIDHIPVTHKGTSVLEIGSGTGVIICGLYLKHPDLISNIVATDINPQAVLNTRMNFEKHEIPGQALEGDLFEALTNNDKFDLIFWNVPFHLVPEDKELTILERSIADPGYKNIERFLSQCRNYLSENGKCMLGFSPDLGDLEVLHSLAGRHNKKLELYWSDHTYTPPVQRELLFQLFEVKEY